MKIDEYGRHVYKSMDEYMSKWSIEWDIESDYRGDVLVRSFKPVDFPHVMKQIIEDEEGNPIPTDCAWLGGAWEKGNLVPISECDNIYYVRYIWPQPKPSIWGIYTTDGHIYRSKEDALKGKNPL